MATTKEGSHPKSAIEAKPEEVLRGFEEAYSKYLRALQETWAPEEINQQLKEAFLNYLRALQEAGPDILKSYEAYFNYLRAWREAWGPERMRKLYEEAYLNYVNTLQQAWAQTNVNALDANSLAMIGQSMLAAACYADNTLRGYKRSA